MWPRHFKQVFLIVASIIFIGLSSGFSQQYYDSMHSKNSFYAEGTVLDGAKYDGLPSLTINENNLPFFVIRGTNWTAVFSGLESIKVQYVSSTSMQTFYTNSLSITGTDSKSELDLAANDAYGYVHFNQYCDSLDGSNSASYADSGVTDGYITGNTSDKAMFDSQVAVLDSILTWDSNSLPLQGNIWWIYLIPDYNLIPYNVSLDKGAIYGGPGQFALNGKAVYNGFEGTIYSGGNIYWSNNGRVDVESSKLMIYTINEKGIKSVPHGSDYYQDWKVEIKADSYKKVALTNTLVLPYWSIGTIISIIALLIIFLFLWSLQRAALRKPIDRRDASGPYGGLIAILGWIFLVAIIVPFVVEPENWSISIAIVVLVNIAISGWTFHDAERHRMNSGRWVIVVLLCGFLGLAIYLLVRKPKADLTVGDNKMILTSAYPQQIGYASYPNKPAEYTAQQLIIIYCSHCKFPIYQGTVFCPSCGKHV